MTELKLCRFCGEVKPVSEFYRDKSRKSGIDAYCKRCRIIDNTARYQANPEANRQACRRYRAKQRSAV